MHSLYSIFLQFSKESKLFSESDKVLLAVSGGADSVVLARLFFRVGMNFAIAHCNFGLRNDESDEDEKFVRELAEGLGVKIFVKRFETKDYSKRKKVSTQLAARELRYNWFEEISRENNYKFIATAHHKNDFTETVLLNLIKGSVLQGLQGIPVKNGKIIRPLLFAEKSEILDYAKDNNFDFRNDSSNIENKYQRNLIRNKVISLLEEINPNLTETVYNAAQNRKYIADFFTKEAQFFIDNFVLKNGDEQQISISTLPEKCFNPAFFNFWLSPYGFNFAQSVDLVNSLQSTESKVFLSQTHKVFKEREKVVLLPILKKENHEIAYIASLKNALTYLNKSFYLDEISKDEITGFEDSEIVYFDLEKIKFPLQIRTWRKGDYFIPFGLGKRKKISDFFKDLKFSERKKSHQILILTAEEEIIWVVGIRTDDRFKISAQTKQVLRIAVKSL